MLPARMSRNASPCKWSVAVSSTCHRGDPCVWMNERQLDYLDAITNYLSNCHVHYNWDVGFWNTPWISCCFQLGFISFAVDVEWCVVFVRVIIIKYRRLDSLNPVGKNNCIEAIFLGNELSNKTLMRQLFVIFAGYLYGSLMILITNTSVVMNHSFGYNSYKVLN